jgi:3,4-dihydroxy-2-butanone 4-phosphate synthase
VALGRRGHQGGNVPRVQRLKPDVLADKRACGQHRVFGAPGIVPVLAGSFQVIPVRAGEAELAVQPVRVRGVQHPPQPCPLAFLDDQPHQGLAQARAAVRGQHVHVGEVGRRAVADRTGEADHGT